MVDHDILCKKLELYGVQQRELSWFRSYLSNRKQFCRVNGVDSNVAEIEAGVPQGSCLGPLFIFVLHSSELYGSNGSKTHANAKTQKTQQ